MDIELRNIKDIWPYEGNRRQNDDAVDAVAVSLREFSFRQPVVVDASGVSIVGYSRWKTAEKLGLAKVPVHVVNRGTRT
jgi:site-specific DNA-methyltransferase (adenine-specific)